MKQEIMFIPTGATKCFETSVWSSDTNKTQYYCACGKFNHYRDNYCAKCTETRGKSPYSQCNNSNELEYDQYNPKIKNDSHDGKCLNCGRKRYTER